MNITKFEKVSLSDIEWISICLYYTKTRKGE